MMELELSSGKKIYVSTTEIIAFKPVTEGTAVVLRPNLGILDGVSQVVVTTPIGQLRTAYNVARRAD